MLKLYYGIGLRISEMVGLKTFDIEQVLVCGGKSKKDRYVLCKIPPQLVEKSGIMMK
jgi:site-specific recombinase XerD